MQNMFCLSHSRLSHSRPAVIVLIVMGLCIQATPFGSETLLERKLSLNVSSKSMEEICQMLREEEHIPICFIDQMQESRRITLNLENVALKTVLAMIVAQAPGFKYEVLNDRVVLFPDLPQYRLKVKVQIRNVARISAVYMYAKELHEHYPDEFSDLQPADISGNPDAAIYADKVSLEGTATVLEQFMKLMGENPGAVFSIVRWNSSLKMYLEQVR